MTEEVPTAEDWLTDEELADIRRRILKPDGTLRLTLISTIFDGVMMEADKVNRNPPPYRKNPKKFMQDLKEAMK